MMTGLPEEVDVVWMHNGWQFLIPRFQRALDEGIPGKKCRVRAAEYDASPKIVLSSLKGAHVLIPAMAFVTEEVLEAAGPQLQLVYNPAVDVSRIDQDACRVRSIPVCHAPGCNANALAESIVMLMLAIARKLPQGIQRCKNPPAGWGGPSGAELRGKTLGIVGITGHSGRRLQQICGNGFGMTVLGVSSKSSRAELEELLKASDYVSLNLGLTEATKSFMSEKEFGLMKEGAVLINSARGGLVDRDALEAALDSGRLGAAGLDVWWEEPCQPDDPLLGRENVVGTPHLGASTDQFFDAISELCVENVKALVAKDQAALRARIA